MQYVEKKKNKTFFNLGVDKWDNIGYNDNVLKRYYNFLGGDQTAKGVFQMKKYNIPNERYESIKANKDGDFAQQKLYNDIQEIICGGYCYCMEWEQVENILDVFNENEDFDIQESNGVFFVQGLCGKAQKTKFLQALSGDIDQAEKEKPSGKE